MTPKVRDTKKSTGNAKRVRRTKKIKSSTRSKSGTSTGTAKREAELRDSIYESSDAYVREEHLSWLDLEQVQFIREILALGFIFLGFLSLWAFLGFNAGIVGEWLRDIGLQYLGNARFLIGLYSILIGVYLIFPLTSFRRFSVASVILLLSLSLIVNTDDYTFFGKFRSALETAIGLIPSTLLLWSAVLGAVLALLDLRLSTVISEGLELWRGLREVLFATQRKPHKIDDGKLDRENLKHSGKSTPNRDVKGTVRGRTTAKQVDGERIAEEEKHGGEETEVEMKSTVESDEGNDLEIEGSLQDNLDENRKLRSEGSCESIDKPALADVERESTELVLDELLEYMDFSEDGYTLPPRNFLKVIASKLYNMDKSKPSADGDYSEVLEETLKDFGVEAKVIRVQRGPTVTRYELQPAKGVKVSQITRLKDDLALSLAAIAIRIEAPIPGRSAIGIEVPNRKVEPVYLAEVLASDDFQESDASLPIAIGKDISGNVIVGDLAKMPHLLIAGATGSGKTVCINSILMSLLYKLTPEQVQFVLIDPKMVEMILYEDIPHLIELCTDVQRAPKVLREVVRVMEDRYRVFSRHKVRNITEYNAESDEKLPYIVVVIDELADLMMTSASSVETSIARIAQLARAAGIHLIVATQRPSVNVITGIIKANIPSRIAFAVASQVDSRVILDQAGAENLIGRGDMLYWPTGSPRPYRVQGAYVGLKEIEALTAFWRRQRKPKNLTQLYVPDEETELAMQDIEQTDRAVIKEAIKLILKEKRASTTLLQRRLKIGFARAGRIMDILEQMGVVGPQEGSKPRKILVDESFLEKL